MTPRVTRVTRGPRAALESAITAGRIYTGADDYQDFCHKIKMSPSTLARRRKAPGELTVSELKRISRAAGISLGELAEQIGG